MKTGLFLFLLLSVISLSGFNCKKTEARTNCYKGRLEIKGICANYTIKLLEGSIDTALIQTTWKNPNSGKTYQNVFGLRSPCSFPENIEEGEEFYFTLTNTVIENCAVCQVYYPTPDKKLAITASKTPCGK